MKIFKGFKVENVIEFFFDIDGLYYLKFKSDLGEMMNFSKDGRSWYIWCIFKRIRY